jgi:hypothetical protein
MMVMEDRSMNGEPLQTESPNPALGKEHGDVGCAMGIAGERVSGEGTWKREARRVTLLAAELGVVLDKETLILCDVRDLMALRLSLQRALAGEARRPWAILRPDARYGSLAFHATACGRATVGACWPAALAKLARALGYRLTR